MKKTDKKYKTDFNYETLSSFIKNNNTLSNLLNLADDDIKISIGIILLNFLKESRLIDSKLVQIEFNNKIN